MSCQEIRRMARKRRSFSGAFKAKVALAACQGDKTTAQLAAEYTVHVGRWIKYVLVGHAANDNTTTKNCPSGLCDWFSRIREISRGTGRRFPWHNWKTGGRCSSSNDSLKSRISEIIDDSS